MKRPGLSLHLASATLFLGLAATEASAAKKPRLAETTPPAAATAAAVVTPEAAGPDAQMKRFDLDGDGMLDDQERAAAKAILMKEAATPVASGAKGKKDRQAAAAVPRDRVMALFDTNKDGRLDEDERAAAWKAAAEKGGKVREALLKRFDRNGDGKLDDAERAAAESAVKKRRAGGVVAAKPAVASDAAVEKVVRAALAADPASLARFDTDRDGQLSDAEWAAARPALGKVVGAP